MIETVEIAPAIVAVELTTYLLDRQTEWLMDQPAEIDENDLEKTIKEFFARLTRR